MSAQARCRTEPGQQGDPVKSPACVREQFAVEGLGVRLSDAGKEDAMADATNKVFLDYAQEELDRAYDQRNWAQNAKELIALGRVKSAETRERLKFNSHCYGA